MKITLEISDGMRCGFFNGIEQTKNGLQMVTFQIGSDDLKDGNIIKLPREEQR